MTWVDDTNYKRGERGNVEPQAWVYAATGLHVCVHRHIDYEPDAWLLTTRRGPFSLQRLDAKDAEGAKAEALKLIADWCRTVLASVDR
jgi:hypothetical protein